MKRHGLFSVLAMVVAVSLPTPTFGSAVITIFNNNAAGVGFNDPTPVAPVGGNPGTTLGQQRINAFNYAAAIWGAALDSDVPIIVLSSFVGLSCTPTAATLGSAGAIQIFANFPGRDLDDTWYSVALANRLSGVDLAPPTVPLTAASFDIQARFNVNLGNPGCLTGVGWYLGLDGNHGTQIDLVTVLLHEFGHGLGFQTFTGTSNGSRIQGLGDIYAEYILDVTTGKHWNSMTAPEIVASAVNSRRVVWDGITVNAEAQGILAPGTPLMTVNSPAAIAGIYDLGAASFGPGLSSTGISGNVVQGLDLADGAGPTTFDACSPLTNAAAMAGNIALVDRGTCGFTVKVANAQAAGAIAVLVADNVAGGPPPGLGGADPAITIPSGRITLADGNKIKAQLGVGVNVTMSVDLSVLAGAEATTGFVHLNAPNPLVAGSSISHWDPITFPNQLMEPAINGDLTHNLSGVDLTLAQMTDIGWFSDFDGVTDGRDVCLGSDQGPTVVIAGCDSGAENDTSSDGCRVSDRIAACANGAKNHGAYVKCAAKVGNALRAAGIITAAEKDSIQACVGAAPIP